ncbi:MAG: T9SS type A sorting domain-containing protein, partial [Sediminibacterium sp.]|nr:T9SS type A sorting domain-containing protein [Sediminibacterium sp.]
NGSSTYSYTDSSLPIGKVYYRIKTYQYDAGYFNSNIVMLETDNKLDFVSVYPNPVTGNSLNVQMNQLEKGNYRVSIINNEGKVLFAQTINHNGSSATQQIQFNRNFTNGVYRLQLVNGTTNKQYSTKIIFTNR